MVRRCEDISQGHSLLLHLKNQEAIKRDSVFFPVWMFVFISPEVYFFSNMQATTGTTVAGDANRNKNPSVLKTLQFPSTASVTENLYMHANQVEYFRTCYITAKSTKKVMIRDFSPATNGLS